MGVVAFWIALAAVLIAGGWVKSRTEAQKHETLRKLIEKGGTADEAQIRALFYPPAPQSGAPWWIRPRARGDGYRSLRVCGTIAMCVAIGMIAFFAPLSRYAGEDDAIVGVGFGVVLLAFGAGLFLASRFAEQPARDGAGMRSVD